MRSPCDGVGQSAAEAAHHHTPSGELTATFTGQCRECPRWLPLGNGRHHRIPPHPRPKQHTPAP